MWSKREEPPRPSTPFEAPAAAETERPAAPPSFDGHTASAVIGRAVTIKGEILSQEDLVVDGEVEGTVSAEGHRITVGPKGRIRANIKARELAVQGSVQGNVEAVDRFIIRKEGSLVGDVKMAGIVIEDGAYFKGSIDITRPRPENAKAQGAGSR